MIELSVAQLVAYILAGAGGITCIGGAVGWLYKGYKVAKKPSETQDARLDELEKVQAQHSGFFARDLARIEAIEKGNRVVQHALLALLAHGIDGNDVAAMKKAKDELQQYLIDR